MPKHAHCLKNAVKSPQRRGL